MNQEKIGKFIFKCRKEKNITQQELAIKLGVTDKAISKWENGRCLMDISLLKPISEILGVSIIEIINGEKMVNNNDIEKSADVIVNTLDYADKSIKKNRIKNILIGILLLIGISIISFVLYKGYMLIRYDVKYSENYKKIILGLSKNEDIKIYKKTIDRDKYLNFDNIKIRNDFENYVRDNNDNIVRFNYDNESFSFGITEQYITYFASDDIDIYNTSDIGKFNSVDRKYFLLRNDINSDIDFLKYIINNEYLENNIFANDRLIKENYSLNLFTSIVMPVIDKITFISGDYLGYIYDIDNIRNVNIIRDDIVYSFTFKGDKYLDNNYLYGLISTIEIK